MGPIFFCDRCKKQLRSVEAYAAPSEAMFKAVAGPDAIVVPGLTGKHWCRKCAETILAPLIKIMGLEFTNASEEEVKQMWGRL